MVDDRDAGEPKLYALFDGDEVDGKRYELGDPIELSRHDAGTLSYLQEIGRIGAQLPESMRIDTTVEVRHMNRAALLRELSDGVDDEKLRAAVAEKRRALSSDDEDGEGEGDDTPDPRLALSVEKMRDDIAGNTDRADLAKLRAAEAAGKNRTTALEAIDARIAELPA